MSIKQAAWEHKYELGIEDIDLQHHYFLNLINRIGSEIVRSDDKAYLQSLISELIAYARFHFISEETMMLHTGYPGYEDHKKLHHDLIEELAVEQHHLLNPTSDDEVDQIINFLTDWFLHHTTGVDREFADYLSTAHVNV